MDRERYPELQHTLPVRLSPEKMAADPAWTEDDRGWSYLGAGTRIAFRVDRHGEGGRLLLPVPRADNVAAEAAAALDLVEPLEGWAHTNALAHRMVVRDVVRALPLATNLAIWSWNRARHPYGDRLATVENLACTAPRLELLSPPGDRSAVLTGVVWPELLPIAMPEADVVLITLAGQTLVVPQMALFPWLDRQSRRPPSHEFGRSGVVYRCGLQHWLVEEDPPDELVDTIRTLGTERALTRLSPADVLDRETVTAARAALGVTATLPARHSQPPLSG